MVGGGTARPVGQSLRHPGLAGVPAGGGLYARARDDHACGLPVAVRAGVVSLADTQAPQAKETMAVAGVVPGRVRDAARMGVLGPVRSVAG